MRVGARHPLKARPLSTGVIIATLSCAVAFAIPTTAAGAANMKPHAAKSLTRAQKLSRALRACRKQPIRKHAACVRRARRQYGPHHAPSTASPTPATPVPAPATPPTAPASPAAGPVTPAGPTDAQIQQWVCEHHINCAIQHLMVLERGAPRLGTGISQASGGDNVPSDTWIFPVLVSFDVRTETTLLYGGTEVDIQHTREKIKAQLDHSGAWAFFTAGSSTTCEPVIVSCPGETGGGA